MHRIVTCAAVLAVLFLSPTAVRAQEAEPLQKSDIIRLLTGTTYTKAEVAGIIRQSCLSFTPTERDRIDFRALGADNAVMTAIEGCEASPAPAAAAPALQFSMGQRVFNVTVGDTVRVPVQVNRGSRGESGLRLQLVGSGALVGGSDARAVTDAGGTATFVFPVGTGAGTHNLTLSGETTIGGSRAVTLRVAPGAPTRASGTPDPVIVPLDDSPATLRVDVVDRYGNAVSGVPVQVKIGSATGATVVSGRTASTGALDAQVRMSEIGGANRLVFVSEGVTLGSSGLALPAGAVADLVVVSGAEQAADPGRELPQPLVLAVTNMAGRAVPDVEVSFSAVNGQVRPEVARSDSQGRASVSVTMGSGGTETVVTARAADVTRSFTFQVTRGGMTAAAREAALLEAARLLDAGDAAGARELYGRVAQADPSSLAAATGVANAYAAEGRYAEAVERYRSVLRQEPSRRDAQVGMARASLGAGNADEAARWFDLALTQDRGDVSSWVGLGDARARLGQEAEARAAYERALDLDPANEGALRGLDRLSQNPLLLQVDVWGGYTDDNGRDPGFRWAELGIHPGAGFELWFAYDDALNFRHPYLVRGQDDIKGYYGGLGYAYGANRSYRTSFEIGRREEPVDGTIQTTWTLDQTFGLSSGGWFEMGGWLGHWYDRDDWVVLAEAGLPVGSSGVVKPRISYGDYFGSGLTDVPAGVPNRAPAKELRVGLAARYEAESGFGVEPAAFYGNVESDFSDELSGSLWDASMKLWYAVSRSFAVDGFVQYQSPPGLPTFWRAGLGLRFGLERTH